MAGGSREALPHLDFQLPNGYEWKVSILPLSVAAGAPGWWVVAAFSKYFTNETKFLTLRAGKIPVILCVAVQMIDN